MTRTAAPRQVTALLTAIASVAGLLAGGCGTAGQRPAARPASAVRHRAGPRSESLQLARHWLALLALPPGACRAGPGRLPWLLRRNHQVIGIVTADFADVHEVLRVPLPPATADAFFQAHRPAGTTVGEAGTSADNSGVTAEFSTDLVRSVPPGISSAELGVAVVPAPGGGSLVRADAEVVWYPRRPAAEHINPAQFAVVRVSVLPGQHTVTRCSCPGPLSQGWPAWSTACARRYRQGRFPARYSIRSTASPSHGQPEQQLALSLLRLSAIST